MSEEILGLDTGADDAARLMNQFIRKDWIDMEPALYKAKWFDYRFMNPVQATYLYAHEFIRFYRLCASKNFSSRNGDFRQPIMGGDLFKLPERKQEETTESFERRTKRKKLQISGIWRGRQFADAMGMPYAEYLEFAFHWTMRFWKQAHPPRPTQMYTDLVLDRAGDAWYERSGAMLFFSKLPQYRNEAYEKLSAVLQDPAFEGKALIAHNAHHEWLFTQLERRHDDPELFARLIWQFQVLPEAKVKSRLGDEAFERVKLCADRLPNDISYH
jgi:hypothetical protein